MPNQLSKTIDSKELLESGLKWVRHFVDKALDGGPVRIVLSRPTRSLDQNAMFHAMCSDVSKQAEYLGEKRSPEQWKVLFISGHAIATGKEANVVPGIEGEFVNLRESSAKMSPKRMSSVIEYTLAWCAGNDVSLPSYVERQGKT